MPIENLAGKKCFLTGAAKGIGRATALAAAARGAKLFLTDIDAVQLESVATEIRQQGGVVALTEAMDVSSYDAVAALARRIHADHGSMDVVMNIAGIAIWGTVEHMEHRHWRNLIEVNLMGPIHVIECFVPEMIRGGRGGHIVNVSSAAGLFGLPWHAAYSASKFGLRGVSEVLRFDLRRHGIGVSLVCPGGVNTPLVDSVRVLGVDEKSSGYRAMKAHFRKRAVSPEKVATEILLGIERNRYMVFTSNDIRIGYWFQRKLAYPYEMVMRLLNDRFARLSIPIPPRITEESGS